MKCDESVIQKIRKLLNTADTSKNSYIEEASTAMMLAKKLLEKHHLSMSQIMDLSDGGNSTFEIIEETAANFKANSVPIWMMKLIATVNIVTDTKSLINKKQRTNSSYSDLNIIFLGESIDVLTSVELFNFLRKTISRLSTNHQKGVDGNYTIWRSFAEGCSDSLLVRAKRENDRENNKLKTKFKNDIENFELVDDDEYEDLDEKSLVLYKQYKDEKVNKIEEYLNGIDAKEEQVRKSKQIKISSYHRGIEEGKKIPLKVTKQITSKNRRNK